MRGMALHRQHFAEQGRIVKVMTKYKLLFGYLKSYYPEGILDGCCYIPWDVYEKVFTHFCLTEGKDDQLPDYLSMRSWIVIQNGIKDVCRIDDEDLPKFEALLDGKYVFSASDEGYNEEAIEEIRKRIGKKYNTSVCKSRNCHISSLKRIRELVFAKDGNKCVYCGDTENLTLDHIIPVNGGGKSVIENFQTLCGKCNSSKSDRIILVDPIPIGEK